MIYHDMDVQRFLSHIYYEPNTGCWLCDLLGDHGYSRINIDGQRIQSHRFAYELFVGEIPDGMEVDHKCNVRCCVNPDHLQLATHHDNSMAEHSMTLTKANAQKTHCKHGHEFTEDNLVVRYDGYRECLTCSREIKRRHYERSKEKHNAPR